MNLTSYSEGLVYFIIFNQSQFFNGEPEAQSSMSLTAITNP